MLPAGKGELFRHRVAADHWLGLQDCDFQPGLGEVAGCDQRVVACADHGNVDVDVEST